VNDTFDCLNSNCITRRSTAVNPLFEVDGQKGLIGEDGWPTCGLTCVYCGHPMSVKDAVTNRYGHLIQG